MPTVSPAQHRLMEAAAHRAGGYGGVSQAVGKKFIAGDMDDDEWEGLIEGLEKFLKEEKQEPEHAADALAFDILPEKSARKYDENGYLHVLNTNISKACVNPYRGSEIPNHEGLRLHPDKIYYLLRDPEELAKAAASFNNLPLMRGHPANGVSSADEHLVKIGTTGTDTRFEHPYLRTTLTIWDDGPIAGIEAEAQRELSSSYRYEADMTPGTYQDVDYDGVMRSIRGNHVALVEAGRAGSDVLVGDAALTGEYLMPMPKRLTARALIARGAIVSHLRPKLAADAKLDMTAINSALAAVTGKNWLQQKPRLATAIIGALPIKLANDEAVRNELHIALDSLDEEEAKDEEMDEGAEDEKEDEEEKGDDRAKDRKARDKAKDKAKDGKRAKDEEEDNDKKADDEEEDEKEKADDKAEDRKGMDKKAMDSAIRTAVRQAEANTVARLRSIREAEDLVRPYVGELVAMDTADEIYCFALDQAGIDHAGITQTAALRALVSMLPKPGAEPVSTKLALDHATGGGDAWLKNHGVAV